MFKFSLCKIRVYINQLLITIFSLSKEINNFIKVINVKTLSKNITKTKVTKRTKTKSTNFSQNFIIPLEFHFPQKFLEMSVFRLFRVLFIIFVLILSFSLVLNYRYLVLWVCSRSILFTWYEFQFQWTEILYHYETHRKPLLGYRGRNSRFYRILSVKDPTQDCTRWNQHVFKRRLQNK